MKGRRLRGTDDTTIAPGRGRPVGDSQGERLVMAAVAGITMTALLAVLTACSGHETKAPAAAAVEACRNAAVQQFNLDSAGEIADPRALPVQDGDSFVVEGSAQGKDWVCTWQRTQSADGVTVKTSINER